MYKDRQTTLRSQPIRKLHVDVLLQSVSDVVQELEQMNTTLRSLVPCLKLLKRLKWKLPIFATEPWNETEGESIFETEWTSWKSSQRAKEVQICWSMWKKILILDIKFT